MTVKVLSEYDAVLDKKKRLTLRGESVFHNYHVRVLSNGKVLLEPRYLARLDELSEETLRMMDSSAENLSKGKAGKPVDFSELEEFFDEE